MINIDEKELEKQILDYFTKANKWTVPDSVTVRQYPGDCSVSVTISRMYDFVEFDFSFLEMLSKFFKTKKINVGDRDSRPGCDTCDYGSSYSLIFHAKEVGSVENTSE